ncbi:MAG TPA: 3-oxoacyl-[acyl-carrier-protein] synthase III C-terminal domain-containing protein [Actinophytocola sp.]|jgi:3-oxoacyl-[acyl-carrier-protein] synthase-3|uniref:3-oxoacyl-[acyl-carrier-protein] synthase III C-terminal domain-containing protein n=1 Tax=Actinophytocola sp. TaxID=1872138 RepID=UPI002DFD4DDC|nr:3-oxoacyl-[acyl-carrier-protein] synthase III C-terminal domain-containing protein [Actinophytocola sp.]
MTALDAVAAYLPDRRVPIEDLAGRLDLAASQIKVLRRYHGLAEVRRQEPGGTVLDLLAAAASTVEGLREKAHRIRHVLYARGVPVALPYPMNPVHELRALLALDRATAFTVTHHGCATSLLAVDIAGRLLASSGEPGALALVVAGEQVFTQDPAVAADSRIFGEGAGACLVSADGPHDRVLSYVTRQRGDLDHWAADTTGLDERYVREYPKLLDEVVLAAVERAGLTLDDITLILPHNVNTVSWKRLAKRLELPVEKVLLDNVPVAGHTFAADAFLNYRTAVEHDLLHRGDRYVIAAAGFGAIFSAMVLQH